MRGPCRECFGLLPCLETLFGNPCATIFLHRTTYPTLEFQWLDFTPSVAFRAVLAELMRLGRQHRAKALVADNRLLRALRPADLELAGESVRKGLSELGGRRFAAVEARNAVNRMDVTALVANVIPDAYLTSQFLSTVEEARAWATQPL